MSWRFWVLFLCTPLLASEEDKPPTLKVLVGKLFPKVRLDVEGAFELTSIENHQPLLTEYQGSRGFLTTTEKGIKWREVLPDIFEMRLTPTHDRTTFSLNGQPFKGCLEIYSIGGTLNIVNEVDIENYLKCHLNDRSLQQLNPSALEAIAIVARTHLHYIAERGSYANWQVKLHKTGYPHPQKEHAIIDAVEKTRGQVLTYQGKTFPTAWSINAAGETISYSAMFKKASHEAPLGVCHLPSHMTRERKTWSLSLRPERFLDFIDLADFRVIELIHPEGTHKVSGLRFSGDKGKREIDFFRLQKALGSHLIRSNDFTIAMHGDRIIFSGYGEGISIGLCLASAEAMAAHGQDASKILARHFPESKLEKLDCKAIYTPKAPWK